MNKIQALIRLPLIALLGGLLLAGCGGGAQTTSNPPPASQSEGDTYNGPAPANADVQAFRLNVWDNLKATNRCGSCHGVDQAPTFARQDDVNLAFDAAEAVMDRTTPENSRLATKVASGHHCWLSSDSACAAVIAAYVSAWAGGATGGGSTEIVLTPPPLRDVGASKALPTDAALFASTVHPLLKDHCAECHTNAAGQSPFIAGDDALIAYAAAKSRINLDTPEDSRVVVRLAHDFHNCWSESCTDDAAAMAAAIQAFSDGVPATAIDPTLVVSKALRLHDGVIAAGGARYEQGLIAKYEFKTGSGNIAYDTSGVEPALDLSLSGAYEWVGGWGVAFDGGKAQGTTAASVKLSDRIKATGEYSVEGWVVPGNVTQDGPSPIISYSGGASARNFTLGQTEYSYDFLNRSSETGADGMPTLRTPAAAQLLQATQQHVVITYDSSNGRRIYVNGIYTGDVDAQGGASLAEWDENFALVLGNEVSSNNPWQGKLRFVAIYNRPLDASQIAQNFAAGVGEKYFLLFSVAELVDLPNSYILFEVSQFDSYSYLFDRPTFVVLDGGEPSAAIPIAGMRIGINGREVTVGQAYRNLDASVSGATYGAGGQVLSPLGTVIAMEQGVTVDEFFLSFEQLGGHTNVVVEADPPVPATPPDRDPSPDIGLRTFDKINASMAVVTGVAPTNAEVHDTYITLRQQLPTVENIEGFLSAHQMGISQLAIEYCNALMDDATLRANVFPGFNFGAPANTAFAAPAQVIDPLLDRVLGQNLTSQPDRAAVSGELNSLITHLTACGAGCEAGRTVTVVKAVCAAALGSAALLIQ